MSTVLATKKKLWDRAIFVPLGQKASLNFFHRDWIFLLILSIRSISETQSLGPRGSGILWTEGYLMKNYCHKSMLSMSIFTFVLSCAWFFSSTLNLGTICDSRSADVSNDVFEVLERDHLHPFVLVSASVCPVVFVVLLSSAIQMNCHSIFSHRRLVLFVSLTVEYKTPSFSRMNWILFHVEENGDKNVSWPLLKLIKNLDKTRSLWGSTDV